MQSEIKSSEKEKKTSGLLRFQSLVSSHIFQLLWSDQYSSLHWTSILPRPVSQPVAPSCPHRVE